MAKKFKYDIYSLIDVIESKVCLWDKTKDVSKDKILRKNAWHDVCVFLEPDFEVMDQKTKEEITNAVMSKWSNIRDTFIKSLKTKSGQAAKKKYVYSDNLQFLLKTVTPDETDSSIPTQPDSEDRPESQQSSTSHLDQSFPSTSKSTQESKKRTGTKRLNTVDAEILKAIQATPAESDLVDDDRAFMMSLLPTVKKLNDDDKFEFRIEVMQLLRSFKNRRLSSSLSNSHITSPRESPFSPQEENQQLLPQPATQQETPQLSSQQDSPLVVIQSVAELFSQDLYDL